MMRFFSRKKRRIRLNQARAVRELDQAVKSAAEESARLWLENAVSRVPVWSGASHATFEALASSIGFPINISTAQDAPDRIALGRLNSGGGIDRLGRGNWAFTYRTDLRYLIVNDKEQVEVGEHGVLWGLRRPTPYNFTETGNRIVEEFARNVKLPVPRLE